MFTSQAPWAQVDPDLVRHFKEQLREKSSQDTSIPSADHIRAFLQQAKPQREIHDSPWNLLDGWPDIGQTLSPHRRNEALASLMDGSVEDGTNKTTSNFGSIGSVTKAQEKRMQKQKRRAGQKAKAAETASSSMADHQSSSIPSIAVSAVSGRQDPSAIWASFRKAAEEWQEEDDLSTVGAPTRSATKPGSTQLSYAQVLARGRRKTVENMSEQLLAAMKRHNGSLDQGTHTWAEKLFKADAGGSCVSDRATASASTAAASDETEVERVPENWFDDDEVDSQEES